MHSSTPYLFLPKRTNINSSNSGTPLTPFQRVATIAGIGLSFIIAIAALTDKGFLAACVFILLGIALLSRLRPALGAKLPFLSDKRVRTGTFAGLALVGIIALPKETGNSNKSNENIAPSSEPATAKTIDSSKGDGQVYYDADGNKVAESKARPEGGKNIPGIKPVDVYGNFENRGFEVDKQIGTEGSFFICTSEENGINYEVQTYCEEGVNDVTTVQLSATRLNPQYNKLSDLKPFFEYGCSIPYEGADPAKAKQFIEANWNKDKASTVISGVKFTIYCPTQFARMVDIERG